MDSDTIHETLEGDMTDSWKIHSRGAVLYSLNAVTKLGMFMTGTASAVKFRDLIIEELTKEVKFEEAYQTVLDGYKKKRIWTICPYSLFHLISFLICLIP